MPNYFAEQIHDLADLRRACWGKTHYFDVDTVRYFRARVANPREVCATVVVVRESIPATQRDDPNRAYRVVIVNLESGRIDRVNATKATIGKVQDRVVDALRDALAKYTRAYWQDRIVRGDGSKRHELEEAWAVETEKIVSETIKIDH